MSDLLIANMLLISFWFAWWKLEFFVGFLIGGFFPDNLVVDGSDLFDKALKGFWGFRDDLLDGNLLFGYWFNGKIFEFPALF
jgi:hypothetical protein